VGSGAKRRAVLQRRGLGVTSPAATLRHVACALEPNGLPLGRAREQQPGAQTRELPALGAATRAALERAMRRDERCQFVRSRI